MTLSGKRGQGGHRRCSDVVITTAKREIAQREAGPAADSRGQADPAAAAAQGSVTDFVLESALGSAAETLADRQSFRLDVEQWEAFVAALDAEG